MTTAITNTDKDDAASRYRELHQQLIALQRKARGGYNHDVLWRFVEPWLPMAEARLDAAKETPADHERWRNLITAARLLEHDSSVGLPPYAEQAEQLLSQYVSLPASTRTDEDI